VIGKALTGFFARLIQQIDCENPNEIPRVPARIRVIKMI
jgi:hypothetical protein